MEVDKIRQGLTARKGEPVKIVAKRGRTKPQERQGVIEETYPSVFTVMVEARNPSGVYGTERMSFTYSDVLTTQVELTPLERMDIT